jgi:O-antigen biosynthesis protein WbqP
MKRSFDIFFSILLIFVTFIPALFICLMIKLSSKGPIIHFSTRVGKDNNLFIMPKFRTMEIQTPPNIPTDSFTNVDKYIFHFGKILRKTSLDELPQLISILKGEMSFVGPRPSLPVQHKLNKLRTLYSISSLIPGITGWAQINGRDKISIKRKIELEIEYKNLKSFKFDIMIVILTIKTIFSRKNISH